MAIASVRQMQMIMAEFMPDNPIERLQVIMLEDFRIKVQLMGAGIVPPATGTEKRIPAGLVTKGTLEVTQGLHLYPAL